MTIIVDVFVLCSALFRSIVLADCNELMTTINTTKNSKRTKGKTKVKCFICKDVITVVSETNKGDD